MVLIREIVQQALTTGYLTVEAENQLRLLLKNKYDLEDFRAFMKLQAAVIEGVVRQQSREVNRRQHSYYKLDQQPENQLAS